MGHHDKRPDGVDTYRADANDLQSYAQAEVVLSKLQVPILLHAWRPHERLYVAAMDGTGNSMLKDAPENWSVVTRIHKQIESAERPDIASGYVEGTFTQDNPLKRNLDGISGYTFGRRVETAYYQFCKQSYEWLKEDPQAQIRVAGVGFSRGSEEVAALLRMIDERGIQDPTEANFTRDKDNLISHIQYTKPALIAPGKTVQAALLFDPVDTGVAEEDRRLPSSVVSALQITAEDERRDLFPASDVLKPGFSEQDWFLNIMVGGSHSDIGDTYLLNGLGIRSHNLGIDYLNALSDRPFLAKRAIPEDPERDVVHRSEQHMHGLFTTFGFRDGVRNHDEILVTRALCRRDPAQDCWNKAPVDPALGASLERRGVSIGPLQGREEQLERKLMPSGGEAHQAKPGNDVDDMIDRLYKASRNGSDANWTHESHAVSQTFLESQVGQAWQAESRTFGRALQLRDQQAPEQQFAAQPTHIMQAPDMQAPTPHAMRM